MKLITLKKQCIETIHEYIIVIVDHCIANDVFIWTEQEELDKAVLAITLIKKATKHSTVFAIIGELNFNNY